MAQVEITVPDIGDFAEVGVIEILVQVGDPISVEQSLITVESDKASMEIPSSHAGVLRALSVKLGDQVRKGSVIALLETSSPTVASVASPVAVAPPIPAAVPAVPTAISTSTITATTAAAPALLASPSVSQVSSTAELPYAFPLKKCGAQAPRNESPPKMSTALYGQSWWAKPLHPMQPLLQAQGHWPLREAYQVYCLGLKSISPNSGLLNEKIYLEFKKSAVRICTEIGS
jgi:glycine cleavage system H lipoate-binding protein